ncbi:MAG TPA: hypothetical protein VH598_05395 [Verrucomicrobiae bacterium]|nr:hypothetical protein [Verrucomicrobiae bacterium]
MELKLVCYCGQKYKFDVEPVNQRMPFAVNCPICGRDGTLLANDLLAQTAAPAIAPPAALAVAGSQLRIDRPAPAAVAAPPPSQSAPASRAFNPAATAAPVAKTAGQYNLWLGIAGAFLGAAIGIVVMYGFFMWTGFKFPLFGTGVGAMTGYGARLLARGTDNTLGVVAAVVAAAAVATGLYAMLGEFTVPNIISMVVGVTFANRFASQ